MNDNPKARSQHGIWMNGNKKLREKLEYRPSYFNVKIRITPGLKNINKNFY